MPRFLTWSSRFFIVSALAMVAIGKSEPAHRGPRWLGDAAIFMSVILLPAAVASVWHTSDVKSRRNWLTFLGLVVALIALTYALT